MPRKKKEQNGVANGVKARAKPVVAPPPPAPPPTPPKMSYRDMKWEMEQDVREFRDRMVEKYRDFNGTDMRKDLSWYMEQVGIGISSEIEREKREERQRAIAERQAAEAAAQPVEQK